MKMETEIIKQAFKLGNSAGIVLPVEWRDKKVVVKLIEKSITKEIIDILDERGFLQDVMGIYLTGSYARGEENEGSDVDILVITNGIDKQIKAGKYEIVLVSKEKADKSLKSSLYLASLLNEARAILNNYLLEEYKSKIKEISLKKQINRIKSALRINNEAIDISEKLGEKVADETLYSVVLRLRELYLIECLKKNKEYSNKEFLKLIKKIASQESYNAYLRVKNDLKSKKVISVNEVKSLLSELEKRIKKLENDKKK